LEETFYYIGKEKFFTFTLNKDVILESLEASGFGDIVQDTLIYKQKVDTSNSAGECFVYAKKK